jgi:cation diffusion facilitator CzcD-associated flavoprotein CzcO
MTIPGIVVKYDVVIIGAGISGINFAYRLQESHPELSYIILEKRHEIGGTWSLFHYPGFRSDSDLYTLGFAWRPWLGTSAIARGDLIIDYIKDAAQVSGIDRNILFHHDVNTASWSRSRKLWTLDIAASDNEANSPTKKTVCCRWLQMCTGYYDYGTPLRTNIPGIDNFKGEVVHPQFWKDELKYKEKNVVIIGSGATAVTLLPALAQQASHVTMLQRSPSYIVSQPTDNALDRYFRSWLPASFAYGLIRMKCIFSTFLVVTLMRYFPRIAAAILLRLTAKQLPSGLQLDPHFMPSYDVCQQRLCLCPDGDFYACLRAGSASIITDTIEDITDDTIKLSSGQELHPDVIVTATGLKLQVAGGMKIFVDHMVYDMGTKLFWKGVMLEGLPNAAMTVGYVDASWTLGADATAQMVCRIIKQMRREGVSMVAPHCSDNEKSAMEETATLNLTSTYIKVGSSVFPKAGDRGQWKARSYYYEDILMAWYGDIKSGMLWIKET